MFKADLLRKFLGSLLLILCYNWKSPLVPPSNREQKRHIKLWHIKLFRSPRSPVFPVGYPDKGYLVPQEFRRFEKTKHPCYFKVIFLAFFLTEEQRKEDRGSLRQLILRESFGVTGGGIVFEKDKNGRCHLLRDYAPSISPHKLFGAIGGNVFVKLHSVRKMLPN